MIASGKAVLLSVALVGCIVLQPSRAHAQWWSRGPADFEECADAAEKAATKEAKAAALSECNAKFAGRRKPGGGYTYYDFMQNRNFDIAGPNPTPEEQKHIDEQYTAFLDQERRNTIAEALMAKKQQAQQVQQASLKQDAPAMEKIPIPVEAPNKAQAAASDIRARMKAANCARHSFSCDWPRLSEGLKDLKRLFTSSPNKAKKS